MCGRYAFAPTKKQMAEQLSAFELPDDFQALFNIAPTNLAWVRIRQDEKKLIKMQWGLVPAWSKDGKNQGKLFNARLEEIEAKPSFKDAVRHRRCLVPADSFYEWRTGPQRHKLPYRILLKNEALLWMAGIWEQWQTAGLTLHTFSILTTKPNAEMAALHNRMPVILTSPEEQLLWLSAEDFPLVKKGIHALPDGSLQYYRVSDRINSSGINDAHLHDAVPDVPRLFD